MATVIYYYYAYMEDGVCVDIERTRVQKTDLTNYVEVTVNEYNAYMNEDTSSEYYIIGKSWDGSEWYLDNTYYYAVINEKFICVNFVASSEEIIDKAYVTINKAAYESQEYRNKKYDAVMNSFYTVSFPQYAEADTTNISVNGEDVTLQSVIAGLQAAIADAGTNIDANTILNMLKGVDGEGSGVDADTLDGHDTSYFASKQELTNLATKQELANLATKQDIQGVAKVTDLANYAPLSALANCASAAEVQNLRNTVSAIKSTELVFGTVIKPRGYRGAYSETLGFRPKAVLVMPIDGNIYYDDIQRGGLYIDDGNDYSRRGCAITDNGFSLYAYEEDGNDLVGGVHLYIAFK